MNAMPTVPNDQVARAVLRFLWEAQIVQNVLHFQKGDGWITAQLVALGEQLVDWWDTSWKTSSPTNLRLQEVHVTDLQPGGGITSIIPAEIVGTGSSPSLPNNVTAAVKLTTGLGGRSNRGRIYHVGLCEGQVIASQLDPTFIPGVVTQYSKLIDGTTITPGQLCVYSQFVGGSPRTTGVPTPVTAVSVDPFIDSQRRRLPGRGR
jgi:hypothetical protein